MGHNADRWHQRRRHRPLFSLLQLVVISALGFELFRSDAIPRLIRLSIGRPWLETVIYISLSAVPYALAVFNVVALGVDAAVGQIAALLRKLRGRFSCCSHTVNCLRGPLVGVTQGLLYFLAMNSFANSVPTGFEIPVPNLLRFLDANGDGALEAAEIQGWVYAKSARILVTYAALKGMQFVMALRKPPRGWTATHAAAASARRPPPMLEKYWELSVTGVGWWCLINWLVTMVLYAVTAWICLTAVGFEPETLAALSGVGGLVMGFAAQQVVANAVAAVIILSTEPCKIGDSIEVLVPDGVRFRGTVKRFGWEATELESFDGKTIKLPNDMLIKCPLILLG